MSISAPNGGQLPPQAPRPVSRGAKLQSLFIGIDSLYLVIEYPHDDVFNIWSEIINHDLDYIRLKRNVLYEDYVIRGGANGYKLSVWDVDARLYMTNEVNDNLVGTSREDHGMGLMLQLGPKWLRTHENLENIDQFRLAIFAQLSFFGVRQPHKFPIRLNRIDIALDIANLTGVNTPNGSWINDWVGYATKQNLHVRNGKFEGLSVGTSSGAVRFKIYDKVSEASKTGDLSFWLSVWDYPQNIENVFRFEWTIKAYQAGFNGMKYLHDLTTEGLYSVLNYASLKWGRLCIPEEEDANRSRWELHPVWEAVQEFIMDWNGQFIGCLSREYEMKPDLGESYIKSLVGWLSGFQARLAIEQETGEPASMYDVLTYLSEVGYSISDIKDLSSTKLALLQRLVGGKSNE